MSIKYDFSGRLVLVTGSTAGIGRVIAEEYVKSGANIIINSRKKESVQKVMKDLSDKYITADASEEKSSSQKIYGCAADLSKADDCNKLIAYVNGIGHLDVLVNNAGTFTVKPFEKITDEEWLSIFNTNVMSTVRMCRAFLFGDNGMLEKGGNIVNISSECGVRSLAVMIHYATTKAAQLNITRGLAELTKGKPNVRVNAILPGPTWTPGVADFMKGFAKDKGYGDDVDSAVAAYFKEHEPDSLKQKFLDPLEVANAVLFISSDAASATNGAAVKVDGGLIKLAY